MTLSANQGAIDMSLGAGQTAVPVQTQLTGTFQRAQCADRLTTPRRISLVGEAAGNGVFDGSQDIAIETVVQSLTNEELEALLS